MKEKFNNDPSLALETFCGLISFGDVSVKKTKRRLHEFLADKNENKEILGAWLMELEKTDLRKEFSLLHIPALVLMGENDALIDPVVIDQLKNLLPEAICKVVKDCGHAPFINKANETQNLINNFINATNNR